MNYTYCCLLVIVFCMFLMAFQFNGLLKLCKYVLTNYQDFIDKTRIEYNRIDKDNKTVLELIKLTTDLRTAQWDLKDYQESKKDSADQEEARNEQP